MNSKFFNFEIPNLEKFGRSETRDVSEIQKIYEIFCLLNFNLGGKI